MGYHIVWSITIPILLTELLFPARRAEPWLGRTGLVIAGLVYAIGALAVGAIFRFAITPGFRTPMVWNIVAALLVIALVALALGRPAKPAAAAPASPMRDAPSPWLVGLVAALAACGWFVLLGVPHVLRAGILELLPMLAEVAMVVGVAALVWRWSAPERTWIDLHRLALACEALLVSMLVGFFSVTAGNGVDQLGQGAASIVAIVLLALFARRLQRRGRVAVASASQHA